ALPRGAYQRQYAWGLRDTLDVAAMQAAGDRLAGRHDFRAFGRSPRPGGHTIRQVREVTVSGTGDWVTIAVAADAFLYGMLGRLAANGAKVVHGKHKPMYTPHRNTGDHVIVINVKGIRVTGKKPTDKVYTRYTGYPVGLRKRAYEDMVVKHPTYPFRHAVSG